MRKAESAEFVYRLPGAPGGSRPGAHRSHSLGPGLTFASHARLFDQPDPRRLDLRASLRSARREWLVRTNKQLAAINIQVIVDVSASMHFAAAGQRKLGVAADLVEALGRSAFRQGDAVGLSGFDHRVRTDLYHVPRSSRGIGMALAANLRACTENHGDPVHAPEALMQCVRQMTHRPAMVFLMSDFHWALDTLPSILAKLSPSCVVPVVIWDRAETATPASGRWMMARDVETGHQRSLWLTAARCEAWRDRISERRADIRRVCVQRACHPFFIEGDFDADGLSRYFLETIA